MWYSSPSYYYITIMTHYSMAIWRSTFITGTNMYLYSMTGNKDKNKFDIQMFF